MTIDLFNSWKEITTLLLTLIVIPVCRMFYIRVKEKNTKLSESYYPYLKEHIFLPFQSSIELSLFKNITPQNMDSLLINCEKLYNDCLQDDDLFFFIDSYFFSKLNNLVTNYQLLKQQTPLLQADLKSLNKDYQLFSTSYFFLLNKTRKSLGFPPRTDSYRESLLLFPQPTLKKFLKYKKRKEIFSILKIVLFLAVIIIYFVFIITINM